MRALRILPLLLCVLAVLAWSVPAQSSALSEGVTEIALARDNGQGEVGDSVDDFEVTDVPIYCTVILESPRSATVSMNFVAVSVKGVKAETKVISVKYTTNDKQDRVKFTGRPGDKTWVAGTYRIDVFVDGKPAGSRTFRIGRPETKPIPAASNLVPANPRPKKRVRRQ